MVAMLVVVLVLVGLPLLAWWVGGRRFWSRVESAGRPDVYADMVRRHRLRPAEIAQVESAASWGKAVDDPHLREAVVDWARTTLAAMDGSRSGRWSRFFTWFTALYAVLVVATAVSALALGEDLPVSFWFAVLNVVLVVGGPLLTRHHLRRAIELNSERATGP